MHSISQHECNENAQNKKSVNAFYATKEQPSRTVVHAKLEMTDPDSTEEVEADAAANDIVQGGKIARSIFAGGAGGGISVSSQMEGRLNSMQGGGQVMPDGLRNMMERGFNRDFSQVRLHTDSEAASLSSSINAKAFTHGNDIYFNQGQFSPNTSEGQKLMAHELTHVVQGGGKIARERDKHAEKIIVDNYFYNSWTWPAFFTFLSNYYPSVVKDMNLKDDSDQNWEKNYGEDFLVEVVKKIIYIERKKQAPKWTDKKAYENALNSVIILFSNPPSSQLAKPFMAMAKIAENLRRNHFEENSEYFNKLTTASLNEAAKFHVEADPLKGVSFDGKTFDNSEKMQEDVFYVTYTLNEDIAKKFFKEESEVEKDGREFEEQIMKFTEKWVDYEYDNDIKGYSKSKQYDLRRNPNSMKDTFTRIEKDLKALYKKTSDQGQKDVIIMIYNLVENREKNLSNYRIDTSNLVSASVWTNIFMTTMKIELSLFLGSACFEEFVTDIVGKAISNEVAKKLASDIIVGVIKDSSTSIIDTLNSSPDELKDITVGEMLEEFGVIILQNMITSTVDLGLKSLSGPDLIEQNRLDELTSKKNDWLSHNNQLFNDGYLNEEKLKELQEFIEQTSLGREQARILRNLNVRDYISDIYSNVTNVVIEKTFDAIKGENSSVGLEDYLKLGIPAVIQLIDEDAATITTAFTDNLL